MMVFCKYKIKCGLTVPCGKRGGIHVNSYLDTANSPVMYLRGLHVFQQVV